MPFCLARLPERVILPLCSFLRTSSGSSRLCAGGLVLPHRQQCSFSHPANMFERVAFWKSSNPMRSRCWLRSVWASIRQCARHMRSALYPWSVAGSARKTPGPSAARAMKSCSFCVTASSVSAKRTATPRGWSADSWPVLRHAHDLHLELEFLAVGQQQQPQHVGLPDGHGRDRPQVRAAHAQVGQADDVGAVADHEHRPTAEGQPAAQRTRVLAPRLVHETLLDCRGHVPLGPLHPHHSLRAPRGAVTLSSRQFPSPSQPWICKARASSRARARGAQVIGRMGLLRGARPRRARPATPKTGQSLRGVARVGQTPRAP